MLSSERHLRAESEYRRELIAGDPRVMAYDGIPGRLRRNEQVLKGSLFIRVLDQIRSTGLQARRFRTA
ncbi:MAG: hypothetical protein DIU67_001225 [Actinomycetes bacterium]|jgi:hypothetical protein|nr:MAG: hypothetical protein DIU67_04610 [Actinomycetota bacterium]